jgi:hypothetical protein
MVTTPISASVSASLSWGQIVKNVAVANNGTLVVNTPGIIGPENYDFANAQVTQEGTVLQPSAQFTLAWAGDFSSVTITNKTGAPWPVNSTIYVALMQFQAPDHNAAIANLTARVAALEAKTTTVVPVVTPQAASIKAGFALSAVMATMTASGTPTSWAITGQTVNNAPTAGYWAVSAAGVVTALAPAIAANIPKGAVVAILLTATNANGTSTPGRLTINVG